MATKLDSKVISAMQRLNDRPIRGESKVWIWKHYLAHSLHFMLMVDPVKESVLVKIQKKVTKYIKRWLNLPRCCTLVTIFHPDVLNLPFLPQLGEQTKMSMITAIELSKGKHIQECLSLLYDPGFLSRNEIPRKVKQSVRCNHVAHWNSTLNRLQVQSKFDIVVLEGSGGYLPCLEPYVSRPPCWPTIIPS